MDKFVTNACYDSYLHTLHGAGRYNAVILVPVLLGHAWSPTNPLFWNNWSQRLDEQAVKSR